MARPPSHSNPLRIRFDEFELDEANAWLQKSGKTLALRPTPFSVLCALARQPGALLTKEALLDSVWGHQFVSESVLKTAISDLRIALGDNPREPRFIETVSRRGYRFIASPAPASSSPATYKPVQVVSASTEESPFFVGRADAMQRMQAAWGRACAGQRSLVWVAGDPGIGKTTLIEHFVSGLGGVAHARGQCVEHYGTGEPYLPVLEALADLCRADRELPTLLRAVAPTWLLQLPWLSPAEERDALRRELAGVGPDRMLREMGEFLDRYTEQRPLLLVTEDLHWSDRATVQLIDYIARRRGPARLMWLASFRLAEVIALGHPLNPLRHELRLHRLCEEIVLDPFSETEVAAVIAQRSAPLSRDESFVRSLHARTDGVPLFVSSVVAEVMERADDAVDVEAKLARMAVPENLAAIIDHYIARLGGEQRTLLQAAAVCGVEFRAETLASALERDAAAVGDACDELVRERTWLAAPRAADGGGAGDLPYSFRHALFRQVLYERTSTSARAKLHRQVGLALQRERSAGAAVAAGELAMHFDRGRQTIVAIAYYAEAAEAALLHFSPTDCMALCQRAAALLRQVPEGDDRTGTAITLETLHGMSAFHSLGLGSEAKDAFGRAYDMLAGATDHPMRRRLLHGYGYLLSLQGDYAEALAVADRADALSEAAADTGLLLAACLVRGQVHHMQGASAAAREWIERGLSIGQPLDLATTEVFAADPQVALSGMRAVELLRSGLVQQARAQLQKTAERAEALRQPMTRIVALWPRALFAVRVGDADGAARLAEEMAAVAEEFSIPLGRSACRWWRGWAEARRGSPREGHRLIREAYDEHIGLGMRAGASEVLGYAAEALFLAGDLAGAQAEVDEALQLADELDERVYLSQLLSLQARLARAGGKADAADAWARRAIDEARRQEAPWLELLALVELCEHHDAGDDDRQALRLLLDRLPEAVGTAAATQARALLAR